MSRQGLLETANPEIGIARARRRLGTEQPLNRLGRPLTAVAIIIGFALWAHFGSGIHAFRPQVTSMPGWQNFRTAFGVDEFGTDSYFTRAAQNGYNLFYFTHTYGGRF